LNQSFSFVGQDRVRLLDRKFYDTLHRAVVAKLLELFLDGDEVLVARQLLGQLEKLPDYRLGVLIRRMT
jgi:hypothetical protein